MFDGKGNSLPEKGYDDQADVLDAVDGQIRFGEERRFSNSFAASGDSNFDLKDRPAQCPEKRNSVFYLNNQGSFGAISIHGSSFSLAAAVDCPSIRKVLFNQEIIYVETLTSRISDLWSIRFKKYAKSSF